jgi:hypothetical protein
MSLKDPAYDWLSTVGEIEHGAEERGCEVYLDLVVIDDSIFFGLDGSHCYNFIAFISEDAKISGCCAGAGQNYS